MSAETREEMSESTERGRRKVRTGKVASNKMEKTIVVRVDTLRRHPLYGKTIRRCTKFKAHDENNDARIGDTVEIMEVKPMSKEKRWRLTRVIERAPEL
jgi:small subunit ribosomal protein S17